MLRVLYDFLVAQQLYIPLCLYFFLSFLVALATLGLCLSLPPYLPPYLPPSVTPVTSQY